MLHIFSLYWDTVHSFPQLRAIVARFQRNILHSLTEITIYRIFAVC